MGIVQLSETHGLDLCGSYGAIAAGGIEITDLAILVLDPNMAAPPIELGETFELSRAGIEHVAVAAHGRVLECKSKR